MNYAIAVKMQSGREHSRDVRSIDSIRLQYSDGTFGWPNKEKVHDLLVQNPNSIKVGTSPYPYLVPEHDGYTKYVKSKPDHTGDDNLLSLPGGPNH